MTVFLKKKIALRHMLIGHGFTKALMAFDDAERLHSGFRKDGVTPEFQHQIEIALFILALKDVDNLEDVICAALLHDTVEDYPTFIDIGYIKKKYGKRIAKAVAALSKELNGVKKTDEKYYSTIAKNKIASVVKGCDRIHNTQTMVGVFSLEKQQKYVWEIETYFIKFLKKARYSFPSQYLAYIAIGTMLKNQVALVKEIHRFQELCTKDVVLDD